MRITMRDEGRGADGLTGTERYEKRVAELAAQRGATPAPPAATVGSPAPTATGDGTGSATDSVPGAIRLTPDELAMMARMKSGQKRLPADDKPPAGIDARQRMIWFMKHGGNSKVVR